MSRDSKQDKFVKQTWYVRQCVRYGQVLKEKNKEREKDVKYWGAVEILDREVRLEKALLGR